MDEYLCFEISIFCSSNCNFWRFSVQNLPLLLFFSLFLFSIMYLQLLIAHCIPYFLVYKSTF